MAKDNGKIRIVLEKGSNAVIMGGGNKVEFNFYTKGDVKVRSVAARRDSLSMIDNMNLLLLSNSTVYGRGYLEHAHDWIKDHFQGAKTILFVPYALIDYDHYTDIVSKAFQGLGIQVISAHTVPNPDELLDKVDGIFIGGGNTFRLLSKLYETNLLNAIADKVRTGMPYMGASAGINVACPTINTTNDMPILFPPSFDAMNLTFFQINPHYIDPDPASKHMGETRETRIKEFLEENDMPVLGLREGTALKISRAKMELLGDLPARLFRKTDPPTDIAPGIIPLDLLSPAQSASPSNGKTFSGLHDPKP